MISRTDERRLDDIIRRAMLSVMQEVLRPIVETPEFQQRLASAIAAQRVPKPANPMPGAPSTLNPVNAVLEAKRLRQREWKRKNDAKKRAATAHAKEGKARQTASEPGVNPVIGLDHASKPDVQVMQPVPPLPAPDEFLAEALREAAADRAKAEAAPLPKPKPAPEVITTTTKEVRAWLIAAMKAGGLSLTQAQDRVGFMTHEQALAEANQRRARAAYPPFALLGSRSAA